MSWIYKGAYPTHNDVKLHNGGVRSIYVLDFGDKTKIGVSTEPVRRMQTLVWLHRCHTGKLPKQVAITEPCPAAGEIERRLLTQRAEDALPGEFTKKSFDEMCEAVQDEWRQWTERTTAASTALLNPGEKGAPRMYFMASMRLWAVMWKGSKRTAAGRWKRERKMFVNEADAKRYLEQARLWWHTGWLQRQGDAMQALALIAGRNITLTELARRYVEKTK
jgi:Fe-S cluster biosynthesis and repair protein YggX